MACDHSRTAIYVIRQDAIQQLLLHIIQQMPLTEELNTKFINLIDVRKIFYNYFIIILKKLEFNTGWPISIDPWV